MNVLQTIRTFNTKNFSVVVEAIEDYDIDLSFDETGEVMEKLESGEFTGFAVRARVVHHGVDIAEDYLGGCIYADIKDFEDHRLCGAETRKLRASGSNAVCGSYFADMVKSVCKQARQEIKKMQSIYVRSSV
jgi:hypothetical protein